MKTGSLLWKGVTAANYTKTGDIFFAKNLVWTSKGEGLDPETGKVVRALKQKMDKPMSHDRCYRNRITHRFYINSKTGGSDFVNLDGTGEHPNPWVRPTCGLAVMPANGLMYNGPYVCQCASGNMIPGFNALYNGNQNTGKRFTVELEPRLIKGSAYGMSEGKPSTASDWPTYRNSIMRSGVGSANLPQHLVKKWKQDIGPYPTAPVVVEGSVFVASRDSHTLYSLNVGSGDVQWTFTTGGRIDSPPNYYKGVVLQGSRDGWVYCLNAKDGQLVWKFNALPEKRLICDKGQLESAWPVNGSILVHKDTAYFAAGRSSFLDGGIALFGLNPLTGEVIHRKLMAGPYEEQEGNFPLLGNRSFRIEGFKSGILSCADDMLFIRHQAFSLDLRPIDIRDITKPHLIPQPGYLDASPQHRTYWTVDVDLCYGGPVAVTGDGPQGDAIAYDGKTFFEIRGYTPGRNLVGRGKGIDTLKAFSVFSGGKAAKSDPKAWVGSRKTIPENGTWKKNWQTSTAFAGHAIAAGKNSMVVAGVPLLPEFTKEETKAAFDGEKGGVAWVLSNETGEKLQEIVLDAAPAWDGIAIANDSCIISQKDGSVVFFSN